MDWASFAAGAGAATLLILLGRVAYIFIVTR
jgi:hypothetical protein